MSKMDEEAKREFFENRMEEHRKEVIKNLSRFIHPQCIDDISDILIYTWRENLPSAMRLAHFFDLTLMDFFALAGEYEEFKYEYIKEQDNIIGSNYYE